MDIAKEKDEKYEKVVLALNQTICDNLKALLKARHLSQRLFCKQLAKEKTSVTRTYFGRILENPKYISAAFLLSCCDFFGITLHNLVSTSFDAKEYIYNDSQEHADYLNIEALLKRYEDTKDTTEISSEDTRKCDTIAAKSRENKEFMLNDMTLVTNPGNTLFAGYMQDYYCYYYPTDSSENKGSENILQGILKLVPNGEYCKATLTVDTNTISDDGNINYKEYSGYAAISPTVNSLNCIMYSDSLCEFCFLMFRYFKINFGKQDCRIAEVLSSSSATEDRRPTVLRMLLSRESIKEEDLKTVLPALSLNYSTIAINRDNLMKVGDTSDIYKEIVVSLINSTPSVPVYLWKEDDVFNLAIKYLKNKESALEFIMRLRSDSYAYRYNKVGKKADDAVRNILLSKGYFKKKRGERL